MFSQCERILIWINFYAVDCPKDFVHVPWLNNSCYQFVTREAFRDEADEYCGGLAEGAHLVTIDDDMERDVLMSRLSSQGRRYVI